MSDREGIVRHVRENYADFLETTEGDKTAAALLALASTIQSIDSINVYNHISGEEVVRLSVDLAGDKYGAPVCVETKPARSDTDKAVDAVRGLGYKVKARKKPAARKG